MHGLGGTQPWCWSSGKVKVSTEPESSLLIPSPLWLTAVMGVVGWGKLAAGGKRIRAVQQKKNDKT